ncbi:MAG: hypothetical protein AVDCRST_MAG02-2582, partial [uncultured Rubrobacteraceae bacterium]
VVTVVQPGDRDLRVARPARDGRGSPGVARTGPGVGVLRRGLPGLEEARRQRPGVAHPGGGSGPAGRRI